MPFEFELQWQHNKLSSLCLIPIFIHLFGFDASDTEHNNRRVRYEHSFSSFVVVVNAQISVSLEATRSALFSIAHQHRRSHYCHSGVCLAVTVSEAAIVHLCRSLSIWKFVHLACIVFDACCSVCIQFNQSTSVTSAQQGTQDTRCDKLVMS